MSSDATLSNKLIYGYLIRASKPGPPYNSSSLSFCINPKSCSLFHAKSYIGGYRINKIPKNKFKNKRLVTFEQHRTHSILRILSWINTVPTIDYRIWRSFCLTEVNKLLVTFLHSNFPFISSIFFIYSEDCRGAFLNIQLNIDTISFFYIPQFITSARWKYFFLSVLASGTTSTT